MKVITLEVAKAKLGINDTASDAKITAQIPYIDAKVKQITKNRYNAMIQGDITVDSPYITVSSVWYDNTWCNYSYRDGCYGFYGDGINNPYRYDSIGEFLEIGQLIS